MTEVTSPASDGPRELHSPKISFEFFPPKTEEMERSPVGDHQPAGAAHPQLRLGDLWRRRIDPRAYPFDHCPHPERDPPDPGRASDLRRRAQGRDRRRGGALSRGRRPPHRGAARRSHHRHRHRLSGASRRLPELVGPDRRHQEALSRYRGLGVGLSGKASGEPRVSTPTSTRSRPRSTPAPPAPSPRCSSTTTSTSATSTACARAASKSRSCPASCRCTISSRRAIS